jgi:hypothetical protein
MDRETAPTGATNSTVSSPLGGLVFINAHVAGRNSGFTLNRHCVNCAVSACPLPVGELSAMSGNFAVSGHLCHCTSNQ